MHFSSMKIIYQSPKGYVFLIPFSMKCIPFRKQLCISQFVQNLGWWVPLSNTGHRVLDVINLKEQKLQSVFVQFPVWERTFQRVHEGPPTKWIFECIFERIRDVRNIKKISHLYIERGFCFGSERSAVPVNLLWLLPRCDKEFPWTLIAKYNANNVIIRSSVYKERTTVFHITKHLVS